jgi:hypothetical protein
VNRTKRPRLRYVAVLVIALAASLGFSILLAELAPPHRVEGGRVALVDPFASQLPDPNFVDKIRSYFESVGMKLDYFVGNAVTVDFLKSFPAGYNVIVFRVHSAVGREGVFYFTAERYVDWKYPLEQLNGELGPARDSLGNPEVFAFGAKFVEKYMKGRFQNALVIGLGCYGAGVSYGLTEDNQLQEADVAAQIDQRPNLAHAIVGDGGVALIGWDRFVTIDHIQNAALILIKGLTENRLSIREAVDTANRQVGPDPVYGGELLYFPTAKGSWTLSPASGPAAPLMLNDHPVQTKKTAEKISPRGSELIQSV